MYRVVSSLLQYDIEQFQEGFADMKWMESKSEERAMAKHTKKLEAFEMEPVDGLDEFLEPLEPTGTRQVSQINQ